MQRGHELTGRRIEELGNLRCRKAAERYLSNQGKEIFPAGIAALAEFKRRIGVSRNKRFKFQISIQLERARRRCRPRGRWK